MRAAREREIPVYSSVPAIAGAPNNFFEGLRIQSRDDLRLSELTSIAVRRVGLPPRDRAPGE